MTFRLLLDLAHLFRIEACHSPDLTDDERRQLLDDAADMDTRRGQRRRRVVMPEDWGDEDEVPMLSAGGMR